ncbi:PH domain-containing protein [Anaerovorax odorimutans]|uniref:PH domain-containing protein n=1 Tax=Anaerovorax odorimutans TaxID=109327 RepID=UPI0004171E8E|nr:PH domain-containing protein [Anaerovorax odorimutans]
MDYSKINKNAVIAWLIGRIIFLLIFLGIYLPVVYKFIMPKFGYITMLKYGLNILSIVLILFLFINTFILPMIEYKEWKYKIKNDRIELINGVFIRNKVIIPISRIQFLEIEQGPIYRRFHLASLNIHTASDAHEIPALTLEEANDISEKLKEIIEMSGNIE